MKILHFIYDSIDNPWLGGGGAFRTHAIYKHFTNCDITVFSANYPKATSNISYQKFIGSPSSKYLMSRRSFVKSAREFIQANHHKYDLIVEDFSPFSPLFSCKIAPPEKVLLILQNYFGLSNHFRKFGPLGFLSNYFERKSIQSHQNILFSSEDLRNQVHQYIPTQFRNEAIIPYGVDEELFIPKTPKKEKYFSFFGRIEIHQKGLDILLDAFEFIVKKYPEFRLKIAGKGKDEKKFRAMIHQKGLDSNIDFVGFIRGEEKIEFLSKSYAMLMPSVFESWGISSLESQACRTPVIGSNIPGLRQTIEHNMSGFLYNSDTEFFQQIENLIQLEEGKYQDLCEYCTHHAMKFRWQPSAEKQFQYYEEILRN